MFQQRGAFLLKKTILIDLDGVLNTYNGTFDEQVIPPIKDGAYEFIKNLSKDYKIKLFTTGNRLFATEWVINNGLKEFIFNNKFLHKFFYYIIFQEESK